MNIYDKWDSEIDTAQLAKDVKNTEKNGDKKYIEVPPGQYEVAVEKMELISTKKGDPMLSIWFKIVTGEYKGNRIFYNQVVLQGFQVHLANNFLRSMFVTSPEINFTTYKNYANTIMDLHEEIEGKYEYALDYGVNNKGFNTYEIAEVFELE